MAIQIYREGGTKTFMACVIEFGQDKRCPETQASLYLFTSFRNICTKNVCLNPSLLSLEMGFCFCYRSMGMFVHIYIYIYIYIYARLEVESVKESLEHLEHSCFGI
ncbi:hypothetical protein NC653_006756 [Populus alba x Populus x berolinensis]|uniref:Uncharacterized protein n=1 Tax=Populus alba x Populus x berolinensis TaxID=444605 RepID=A0AAD6RFA4_9ROSI|nr:hypothetical protein NC653_006756 [Populus alba x Populus x berolinensis]